eukprot:873942-Rhodomonas_salina.1
MQHDLLDSTVASLLPTRSAPPTSRACGAFRMPSTRPRTACTATGNCSPSTPRHPLPTRWAR